LAEVQALVQAEVHKLLQGEVPTPQRRSALLAHLAVAVEVEVEVQGASMKTTCHFRSLHHLNIGKRTIMWEMRTKV
jgi:hypothetical protein